MEDDGNHKATEPEKVNNTFEDTFVQNKEKLTNQILNLTLTKPIKMRKKENVHQLLKTGLNVENNSTPIALGFLAFLSFCS